MQGRAYEFGRLLDMIEDIEGYLVDSRWRKRYVRTTDFCLGRQASGWDSIYYDPWRRCKVDAYKGNRLCNTVCPAIPDSHPRGWDFESISDGWELAPGTGNDRVSWEGDGRVPGDEKRDQPDDAADEVVSAPSGEGSAAGPSDAAPRRVFLLHQFLDQVV